MFAKFVTAGETEYVTVDPTEKGKTIGRTWILLCPETLKVLVLFIVAPPDTPVPPLGTMYQIIKLVRRPGPTVKGLIGQDRHEGGWYRMLPSPGMQGTQGET